MIKLIYYPKSDNKANVNYDNTDYPFIYEPVMSSLK